MKKKILLIEDDADTADIVRIILEEEFHVETNDSVMPVDHIEAMRPDLIILDHRLRNGFGGDLCQALKKTHSTSYIPILLMSAYYNTEEVAKTCGADQYIYKPFDIEHLRSSVASLIAAVQTK